MNTIPDNYLITHKFFSDKFQHVSMFGRFNESKNEMTIYVVTCSKKDMFSKRKAVRLFGRYLTNNQLLEYKVDPMKIHPTIYIVGSTKESFHRDFIDFGRKYYWQKETVEETHLGPNISVSFDVFLQEESKQMKYRYNSLKCVRLTADKIKEFRDMINSAIATSNDSEEGNDGDDIIKKMLNN